MRGSSGSGAVSTRATISNSVTLQPGQHYLVAHTGFSNTVKADQKYASEVPDTGGFAIVSGTTIIDQVGFSSKSAYKERIPLAARVFAVLDVWEALRAHRPHRPAWSDTRALSHITSGSGLHFDPRIVDLFRDLLSAGRLASA